VIQVTGTARWGEQQWLCKDTELWFECEKPSTFPLELHIFCSLQPFCRSEYLLLGIDMSGSRMRVTLPRACQTFAIFMATLNYMTVQSLAATNVTTSRYDPIGNVLDPGTYFFGLLYQLFPARTGSIFPFTLLPRLTPSIEFYRLNPCPRADIATCLPYGAHITAPLVPH
jgi:hypothetical protein